MNNYENLILRVGGRVSRLAGEMSKEDKQHLEKTHMDTSHDHLNHEAAGEEATKRLQEIMSGTESPHEASESIENARMTSENDRTRSHRQEDAKLDALRARLQAGENSLLVDDFDAEAFLADLHQKHKSSKE